MSISLVRQTAHLSLYIQFITGIITTHGLFKKLNKQDEILKNILQLETFVQFIEFTFYLWFTFLFTLNTKSLQNLTLFRYLDWLITTPTMLVSTIAFMKYNELKEKNKQISFMKFLTSNATIIKQMCLYNVLMLFFGLLGELKILPLQISTLFGFYFFIKTFEIVKSFGQKTKKGSQLFYFMFIVWAMYGIASLLSIHSKNIFYNGLDVVSKNFYGLFIYYIITQL